MSRYIPLPPEQFNSILADIRAETAKRRSEQAEREQLARDERDAQELLDQQLAARTGALEYAI